MPVYKQNDVFAGRYGLTELVGEGGFSEVWKANDQMADDAVVALKIYAPEKGLDDYGVRQFRKEFSLTHHLAHPHLMKVYHFDITDGSPYLIMPYCPYGSLSKLLADEGTFSERQVALVMCQIGSALHELHKQEQQILHQDIKPDNILVLNPESFLLADFGISNQIRHTLRKATSDMKSLTIAYAPPERFDRHPVSDASSDIFSFGVTLYEVCTNSIPWDGYGGQSLLKGAQTPDLPEGFSPELNRLLQACMSVDRRERPTAEELYERGKHFLETGQWKPQLAEPVVEKSFVQKFTPYLLAAAISLFAITGFWFYNYTDAEAADEASAKLATSLAQEKGSRESLEARLKVLESKAAKLEAENKKLLQNELTMQELLQDKDGLIASYERELLTYKNGKQRPAAVADDNSFRSAKDLQEYLNQISNPKISKKVRTAWKQETISQFADGSVKVLDESDGTVKQYSASILLNLLINVPHRIVVKEMKKDRNNKVTELRLSMQSSL
ncbi:serine/threonine-protein kinase [Cesiribacter sp. SM1]|uniref:serine/threonine-protein kinase n=1 Tax=Cesiribacter sp. SM1 TaxID=2861196 RepID=UPI001CD7F0E0|nr:serine/threonine-protein kinase [Cesiribacter sp. SM1]